MARDADWGAATYLATSSYVKGAANPVYINNCLDDTSWSKMCIRDRCSGSCAGRCSTAVTRLGRALDSQLVVGLEANPAPQTPSPSHRAAFPDLEGRKRSTAEGPKDLHAS